MTLEGATDVRSLSSLDIASARVHMIGIGGSGMSGAARLLLDLGATVSGSDLNPFDGVGTLVAAGARITIGQEQSTLPIGTDLVVVSAAIPESNRELAMARQRGNTVIKYAQLLGLLMARRTGVAIAGTHGKTTTTAMCSHLFRQAGLDPSFVFGAKSNQLGGNSGVGSGPHLIVESCEFDRSFLHVHPRYAAILNIEPDHLDCYRNIDEIVDAFGQFASNVSSDGVLVCNAEDVRAMEAARQTRATLETFGFDERADWRAVNLASDLGRFSFEITYHGSTMCSSSLSIPGRHNVANALAAVALAHHAGGDLRQVGQALSTFVGVSRRMSWRGEGSGVTIVDDYAHHPTEIRVTIEAARYRYRPKRTWVVFQPHQCARTRHLLDEFAGSFEGADEVIVPDIFAAREGGADAARRGSQELVSRIRDRGGNARYLSSLEAAAEYVANNVSDGDLVVTMGAGDVWKVADELVERIC